MNLKEITNKAAKQDLKIVDKKGSVTVTGTKIGNVTIKRVHGCLYRFENFNTGELVAANRGANAKSEAVEFLSSLYIVEGV